MKKNCGSCNYRVPGTDTHMVCSLRDYVLRVSKTDKCTSWKGDYFPVEIPQKFLREFSQLIMIGIEQANEDAQHTLLSKKEEQELKFAEKLVKYYA
jgi:hypothetical protein